MTTGKIEADNILDMANIGDATDIGDKKNCIDILCCPLVDIDADLLAQYEKLLSDEERARLQSFRSDTAAKEFLVARALLRTALAERLNCAPQSIQFCKNADGKPLLANAAAQWQFNVSHSHDWVVVAICKQHVVGIDIESKQRRNNLAAIAKRFFSDAENHALAKFTENHWTDYFFAIWTLKEAHAKALGCGLPKILNHCSIDIDFAEGGTAMDLRETATTTQNISSWLYALDSNYLLALVAHGEAPPAPQILRCVPLRASQTIALVNLAHGYQTP